MEHTFYQELTTTMSPFWQDGLPIHGRARGGVPINGNESVRSREPVWFTWKHQKHRVTHIGAYWRVHTNWWTDHERWRDYYEVITDTGWLCVLFHDLLADEWRLERVYT